MTDWHEQEHEHGLRSKSSRAPVREWAVEVCDNGRTAHPPFCADKIRQPIQSLQQVLREESRPVVHRPVAVMEPNGVERMCHRGDWKCSGILVASQRMATRRSNSCSPSPLHDAGSGKRLWALPSVFITAADEYANAICCARRRWGPQ